MPTHRMKIEYAIDRFAMEVKRQMDVLDRRLGEAEYLGGADYSIADMAVWPWYGALAKGVVYEAGEFLDVASYKNVQRWTDAIAERPAVKRGRMVNRVMGEPSSQLRERHDASDFDTKTQDKLDAAAGGVGNRRGPPTTSPYPRPCAWGHWARRVRGSRRRRGSCVTSSARDQWPPGRAAAWPPEGRLRHKALGPYSIELPG